MSHLSRWPLLLSLLLLSASLEAGATTLLRAEVPQLAREADAVVHATVKRVASRWSADGRRIVTDVVLEVKESLKGTPGRSVTVVQPGGRVGGVGQRVDGLARFAPGEEVVVFLARRGARAWGVAGMAQGKFRVERAGGGAAALARPEALGEVRLLDPATREPTAARQAPLPLEDLKAQVREAARQAPRGEAR